MRCSAWGSPTHGHGTWVMQDAVRTVSLSVMPGPTDEMRNAVFRAVTSAQNDASCKSITAQLHRLHNAFSYIKPQPRSFLIA